MENFKTMVTIHKGTKENKRIVYFDILNILAIIAVISMHMNGIVHVNPNIRAWNTSLIVDCIMYWAVPVFMMISGATLMKYREKYDTKTFFKKRFTKILIPFLFWAIFMFVWKITTKQIDVLTFSGVKDWINAFFTNQEEGIYYFLFEILGVYLTMPVLSLLTNKEYRKTLWLIVALFFIFNGFLPNILGLFNIYWNEAFEIRINGYLIYVILGYLLSTEDLSKKQKNVIYIGAIIGLIYRYVTTFVLSKEAGSVIRTTWGYFAWHCILLSCAVFIFVKDLQFDKKLENKTKVTKALSTISSCSFGIYLIHMIVKYYITDLLNWNEFSWSYRSVGIIITYCISLIIVYLLKKIPVVKKVVP